MYSPFKMENLRQHWGWDWAMSPGHVTLVWSQGSYTEHCHFLTFMAHWLYISVQFSQSVLSDSLRPHGLQPVTNFQSLLKLMSIDWWCHPTISSSVIPFSSCLQYFQASGSFSMSQFFTSGGQRIGVSASASVLTMNIQGWFPLGLELDLLAVQGTLKNLLQHHSSKASILWRSAFFIVQLSHPYMTTGKTIALTRWTFVGKVMSLLFFKI